MDINAAVGGDRGLSRAKIDAALGVRSLEDAGLSPRERLALEYADRVSATPVDVPDDFFAGLAREFSEREIVELTSTIAHESYNSKFNRPLRIESNNFCELPLPSPEEVLERVKRP
jgi:alkylhydroperoxidase family enzyme